MPPKPKGPPPKGQKSIASFMFKKKPPDGDAHKPQEEQPGPSAPQTDLAADDAALPAAKRRRGDGGGTPPSTKPPATIVKPQEDRRRVPSAAAPTLTVRSERHSRWQSKLLGDGSTAGMGPTERVRTQEALDQQQDKHGKLTPLETQVAQLKAAHPDVLLAVEVGYKVRFFGRDAEIASQVLGIFAYPDRNYLTASIPIGRIDHHVRRLALAGHKVGVVRQVESAAIKAASDNRNKPFERRLTATYTRATLEAGELAAAKPKSGGGSEPGESYAAEDETAAASPATHTLKTDDNAGHSAFLVCVVEEAPNSKGNAHHAAGSVELGIIAVETSTGEVFYSQVLDGPMRPELESRLMFAAPSELLLVAPLSAPTRRLLEALAGAGVRTATVDGAAYRSGGALAAVTDFYTSRGAGLEALDALPPLVLRALGHALDHLRPFGLESVLQLGASFVEFSEVQEMALSPNALSQLEILTNNDDGGEKGSLLWLMDRTRTAAGARLVRRWVSRPLREVNAIEERLEAVEELLEKGADHEVLSALPRMLKELPDVERILGRVLHGNSSPPEFLALLRAFQGLPAHLGLSADLTALKAAVERSGSGKSTPPLLEVHGLASPLLVRALQAAADPRCAAAAASTLASIDEAAAAAGDTVNLFMDDERFSEVAEKRQAVTAAEEALEALRPKLAAALNVRSVAYVSVANQGSFLVEVPVDLEKRAPKTWDKICSTKKVVRFRPPEVKRCLASLELERERLAAAAAKAWRQLQAEFSEYYAAFRAAVRALATLDCLNGFAGLAAEGGYVRPEFVPDDAPPQLHVVAGRHPVLDVLLQGGFVPNDIDLEGGKERCAVITGPNMGGKSCYSRQAALLACMAQAGCFVPAQSCRLHAVDQVFTRMGAADNLALGRSTFLEELGEASLVLEKATPRSLVIIDELGRGTSTKDGQAIAAATLEYIVHDIGCLTLFITHYPEVAELEKTLGGALGAYCMAHVVEEESVSEDGAPKVTFLYKVKKGVAEASYGLNVARMAGLPAGVIQRAAEKAREAAAAGAEGGSTKGDGENGDEEERRLEEAVREAVKGLRSCSSDGSAAGGAAVRELQARVAVALQERA